MKAWYKLDEKCGTNTPRELIDLEGHLYDLFEIVELPKDEWGFRKGTFKIIVEWEYDDF